MLHFGRSSVRIDDRTVGGLTGSRVALALSRVPVETAMRERHAVWKTWGFPVGGQTMMVSSYVDNLFSCSASAEGAIRILEDAEVFINQRWGHKMKPSSKMVMPVRGSTVNFVPPREWQVVTEFMVLGHIIADNGSTVPCLRQTEVSV